MNTLQRFFLVFSAMAGTAVSGCGDQLPAGSQPPSPVRVGEIQQENISPEVTLTGTILPVEISRVASAAAGKIEAYHWREGTVVQQGEPICVLKTEKLKIEIEAAKATMREKKARYDLMKEGYRREEIEQARARVLGAIADRKFTQARLRRIKDLHSKRTATDDQLEEAASLAQRAEQTYNEAKANWTMKSTGFRAEEVQEAQAAYDAQFQEVERLGDILSKHTIRAPFSGYLVEKHTDVGQWVIEGGPVATMIDLTHVDVVVHVEESFIDMLRVGQSVDVWIDAQGGRKLTGQIVHIIPKSAWAAGSRSFPVRVRLENEIVEDVPRMKEGMLARVLLRGPEQSALLAPKDAIVRSRGEPTVFVVDARNMVRPVIVTEGISAGQRVVVTGEIKPGDRVVTEGAERLRPLEQVSILEPPADETSIAGKPPATGGAAE